jgi:ABC-type Fe3+-hydroxamate transport system substrate-binding protein
MTAEAAPERIVSLVPSLTETLVHFGLLDRLVGRTRYCVEPAGIIEQVETVGGTKNPDISRIIELDPDLVILNREENRRQDWQALVEAGIPGMVTHPRTVPEAADMLEELGRRAGAREAGAKLAEDCRQAAANALEMTADLRPPRVFCPIWRNPWMTFTRTSYVGGVLEAVGMENVFGDEVVYRDGEVCDFFEISIERVLAKKPQVVLLPDEPYVFSRKHGEELAACGVKAEIFYIDGKDLCWYGPRIPDAIEHLLIITSDISRI